MVVLRRVINIFYMPQLSCYHSQKEKLFMNTAEQPPQESPSALIHTILSYYKLNKYSLLIK